MTHRFTLGKDDFLLDGAPFQMIEKTIELPRTDNPMPVLDILVEGMGHINFAQEMIDRKGIYCPAPWLKAGVNEVVVFDLHQTTAAPAARRRRRSSRRQWPRRRSPARAGGWCCCSRRPPPRRTSAA